MPDYILITPVKNEESFLPFHIQSIINQKKLPILWVFIDGGSHDNTIPILQQLQKEHKWIHLKDQENFSGSGGHANFALAVWEGYNYARRFCNTKNINFDFIAKLDADSVVSPNFFEYLLARCEEDPKLGCVSGKSFTLKQSTSNISYAEIYRHDLVEDAYQSNEMQDKRLYRKICLDSIGGFPVTKYAPDSVILAKIRMNDWKIKCFDEIFVINLRGDTGTERNNWRSSKQMGKARYYLGYHPLLILGGMWYLFWNRKIHNPLAFIAGYLESWIKKEEMIEDLQVKEYFRKKRLKEMFNQKEG